MSLAEVWSGITPLLEDNVSLIAVTDKAVTNRSGTTIPAKVPYSGWKKYQSEHITADQLWQDMETHNTKGIAMICGQISGNLEIIDIDVKYKAGIDATLFKDLSTLYPNLYNQLKIHRTPSGGYHILYRVIDGIIPGNQKLAGRYATEDELINKPRNKTYNFIETRGEGGYALSPPAMGYSVHKGQTIPLLSWEERCSLITLAKTYTEIAPVKSAPKADKRTEEIYSSNPFEDYDNRVDPIELLESFDWAYHSETTDYLLFTRPGKDSGISGSWHKTNCIFFVFTSSTELEPDTGYRAATLLSLLMFNGDNKETFKYLVKEYYGVFADFYEDKVIKRTALNGGELPKNFSERAKAKYEDIKQQLSKNLPYGYFWQMHPTRMGEYKINREHLYRTAELMGFRRRKGSELLYKIEGKILVTHNQESLYLTLKNYVWDEQENSRNAIWNALDAFQQASAEFSVKQMPDISDENILNDEAYSAYKFFKNGVLHITAEDQSFHTYEEAEGLVWADKIKPREWSKIPGSALYAEFIANAVGISDYVKRVIGYLAHDFRSESSGYVIVLLEKTTNPKDGGGTGKNILGNMFAGTNSVKTVPGASVKLDDRFLAAWHGERIFFLADIPKSIDWAFLKEMATGTGYVNKKYIAEYSVNPGDMPKILVNTNYSFEDIDGGVKRRLKTVEFNNFYAVRGGVDVVHGKMFPDDFDEQDWAGYDHFMVECLQALFKAKGKLEHSELSYEGWLKKFYMNHGESTFMFVEDNIKQWIEVGFVPLANFNYAYSSFCTENGIRFSKGDIKLSDALHDYCSKHGIIFINSDRGYNEDKVQVRGKRFKIDEI